VEVFDATDGREAKAALRRQMLNRREAMPLLAYRQAGKGFCRSLRMLLTHFHLPDPDSDRPLRIATYAAMRREADLAPALSDLLLSTNLELYYPAVTGQEPEAGLVLGRLPQGMTPRDFLVAGRFGVAEPPEDSWLDVPPELDILFLPGLAFDPAGNRLGWGRAYYDRLIPTLPGRPKLVGVCYAFQIIKGSLPVDDHDQPVDILLTPEGIQPVRKP
jgi:5-formyltetrahydrofolate cyclo-ligase